MEEGRKKKKKGMTARQCTVRYIRIICTKYATNHMGIKHTA
jgi:hypothetical protein